MNHIAKTTKKTLHDFLALFTQAKSFKDNIFIGNQFLNRLGLHVVRVIIAHLIIRFRQYWVYLCLKPHISAEDRRSYFKNGYIIKHDILSTQELALTREEFERSVKNMGKEFQGDTCTTSLLLTEQNSANIPLAWSFLADKKVLALLQFCSGFFLKPWLYFLQIENGVRPDAKHRGNEKGDPQKRPHSDAFHPTMKAWYFLEDVSLAEGPFFYYPGSQRLSLKRLALEYHRSVHYRDYLDGYSEKGSLRLDDKGAIKLGLDKPVSFTVPGNTLIIANTYGFHGRSQAEPSTVRRSLWMSAWRAPFLPLPLPNFHWLQTLFENQMQQQKNT